MAGRISLDFGCTAAVFQILDGKIYERFGAPIMHLKRLAYAA